MRISKLLTATCLLIVTTLTASAVELEPPSMAPRPVEIQKELPPRCGFIPPRLDLSHLTGKDMPARFSTSSPPSAWDWRTQGKVTPVKNQSTCGSCYSFASLANIEAKMLIDGEGTFDFSENNAKECNGYANPCNGGNYDRLAGWLSRKGTVLESCDPYAASDVACKSSCTYQKTLLDWHIISADAVPSTTVLQQYIYDNGPVYTSLYAGNGDAWASEFNTYDGSYTLTYGGSEPTNHAVCIVGWDNSLNGGSGAWIVKNSWGTSWGGTCGYGAENGYFTIAYGSANIGMYSSYIGN